MKRRAGVKAEQNTKAEIWKESGNQKKARIKQDYGRS